MNELEQAMREVVQQNAYMQHLGIEVESLSADYVCTKMPYKEELTNPYGMFHGGCLYSLCDITAGLGACMGGYFATTVNGPEFYAAGRSSVLCGMSGQKAADGKASGCL